MHQYTVKILQFKNVHNLNSKFINLLYCREPLTTESKHYSETSEEVGQPLGLLAAGMQQWLLTEGCDCHLSLPVPT